MALKKTDESVGFIDLKTKTVDEITATKLLSDDYKGKIVLTANGIVFDGLLIAEPNGTAFGFVQGYMSTGYGSEAIPAGSLFSDSGCTTAITGDPTKLYYVEYNSSYFLYFYVEDYVTNSTTGETGAFVTVSKAYEQLLSDISALEVSVNTKIDALNTTVGGAIQEITVGKTAVSALTQDGNGNSVIPSVEFASDDERITVTGDADNHKVKIGANLKLVSTDGTVGIDNPESAEPNIEVKKTPYSLKITKIDGSTTAFDGSSDQSIDLSSLSKVWKSIGRADTDGDTQLSDGLTTNPIIMGGVSTTAEAGNVVIQGDLEYAWLESSGGTGQWTLLGDPTYSGDDTWISVSGRKVSHIGPGSTASTSTPSISSSNGEVTVKVPAIGKDGAGHVSNIAQTPLSFDKTDLGLGNVDNTADKDKVVSQATKDGSGNVISSTYVKKSSITTSISSSGTDEQVPSAKAVYDGTVNVVTLTQAEYDALTTKAERTVYLITDDETVYADLDLVNFVASNLASTNLTESVLYNWYDTVYTNGTALGKTVYVHFNAYPSSSNTDGDTWKKLRHIGARYYDSLTDYFSNTVSGATVQIYSCRRGVEEIVFGLYPKGVSSAGLVMYKECSNILYGSDIVNSYSSDATNKAAAAAAVKAAYDLASTANTNANTALTQLTWYTEE